MPWDCILTSQVAFWTVKSFEKPSRMLIQLPSAFQAFSWSCLPLTQIFSVKPFHTLITMQHNRRRRKFRFLYPENVFFLPFCSPATISIKRFAFKLHFPPHPLLPGPVYNRNNYPLGGWCVPRKGVTLGDGAWTRRKKLILREFPIL